MDLLDVVEAAYSVDLSDSLWLEKLARAARPHLDEGFGLAAFEYFLPESGLPRIVQHIHLGIPPKLAAIYQTVFDTMAPEIRMRPFRLGPCIAGSQMMGMRGEFREHPHMKRFVQAFGMYDSIWITAVEPEGRGCGFHAGRSKIGWATREQVARWGRIAAHLSTAVRLRHLLKAAAVSPAGVPAPAAILDPDGRVHDAQGAAATTAAREHLRRAVVALEHSRGANGANDPDRSLEMRKTLVAGHWTLLDEFDQTGRRYIVARQNEPRAPGPSALTARERQVVAYARLGHHNKLIAYDLGIAASTVRVLLARAAAKVGVRTRGELLCCAEHWKDSSQNGRPRRPAR